MRGFLVTQAVVGIVAVATAVAFGQAKPSTSQTIQGVWKVTELVRTGANATKNSNPQPSLYIFTARHYSTIAVNGTNARAPVPEFKNPDKPTDAEKVAMYDMWEPVAANSGTYEINGTTLTRRPLVARNVGVMTASFSRSEEFSLQGNTLVLTLKSAAGQPASETRLTLTRVAE